MATDKENAAELRTEAEAKFAALAAATDSLSDRDVKRLYHELQIHQVALEMQNAVLTRTKLDLEATRGSYFDLYELAPVGYLTLNKDRLIQRANLTAASKLGLITDDLLNRPIQKFIFSDDVDSYYLQSRSAVEAAEDFTLELRLVRLDGSPFWVSLQVSLQSDGGLWIAFNDISDRKQLEQSLRQANDTLEEQVAERTEELTSALTSLQQEIDERNHLEKALRASEGHYRSLVNTIPHGITVIDREHRIVKINDSHARMYGHPREWFLGRHCYEVFEKRDHICPHCPGVESMQTGEVAHAETEGVHDDGTRFSVVSHTAPFQLDDGSIGFIEVVEDVTEKKKLEASARKSARLASLGEMATGVAHEINNPITGVINCTQLAKDRLAPDHPIQSLLDRILREGGRIAAIVRSLLSICHPGELADEKRAVAECLKPVLNLCRSSLGKDGIALDVDVPEGLPQIKMQRQMIEQLLLNLINNAHYALNARFPEAHPDKLLAIRGELCRGPGGDFVRVEVYDQGTGIAKAALSKVFDPFFTTKPAGVGTGLGLGLCYDIVKRHNGEIRIESEFGKFTRVTVELPVLP